MNIQQEKQSISCGNHSQFSLDFDTNDFNINNLELQTELIHNLNPNIVTSPNHDLGSQQITKTHDQTNINVATKPQINNTANRNTNKHKSNDNPQLLIQKQQNRINELENQVYIKETIIQKYERKFYQLFSNKNQQKEFKKLESNIQQMQIQAADDISRNLSTKFQKLETIIQDQNSGQDGLLLLDMAKQCQQNVDDVFGKVVEIQSKQQTELQKLRYFNIIRKKEMAEQQVQFLKQKNKCLIVKNQLLKQKLIGLEASQIRTKKKVKVENSQKQGSIQKDVQLQTDKPRFKSNTDSDRVQQLDLNYKSQLASKGDKVQLKSRNDKYQYLDESKLAEIKQLIQQNKHSQNKQQINQNKQQIKQNEQQSNQNKQQQQVDQNEQQKVVIIEDDQSSSEEGQIVPTQQDQQTNKVYEIAEKQQFQQKESKQQGQDGIEQVNNLLNNFIDQKDDSVVASLVDKMYLQLKQNATANQLSDLIIRKLQEYFQLGDQQIQEKVVRMIDLLVQTKQEYYSQNRLMNVLIKKTYSQLLVTIFCKQQIESQFYVELLAKLGIIRYQQLLESIELQSCNHVQLVFAIMMMFLAKHQSNISWMMQICYKMFESYNKMRSYQNQQQNLDKLFRQFQCNKLFFLVILDQYFFGFDIWKVKSSCQSDLFLFKNDNSPVYQFKINQTYEKMPYFGEKCEEGRQSVEVSNQMVSLVLKYIDIQMIYQFYVQNFRANQKNHSNYQISLTILYIYWTNLKVEGSFVFQKSRDYLLNIFQKHVQDIPVQLKNPKELHEYLNPKKLNFSFYIKNLLDQICIQIEKEQHLIQQNLKFDKLHFDIYDYLNSIFVLAQMMSPQLIQQLMIEKILLGYLNNPKFNQSINQYLSIISYAVINQFIHQMKTNDSYFKKLTVYMRNQLVSILVNNQADDELNTKQILAFVVFTDCYDQQYIQQQLKLDMRLSLNQLQYLNSHFGQYYLQFYNQVKLN